jgi:flagellar protein FlaJ
MAKEEVIKLGEIGKMEEAYAPKIEKKVNWRVIIFTVVAVIGILFGLLGAVKLIDSYNLKQDMADWNEANDNYKSGVPGIDPPGPKPEPSFDTGPIQGLDFLIIAILGTVGPIGFYMNWEQGKTIGIERRLPDFLRDLAESGKFGMTLAASIQAAAKGKYGPLTPEIQRMSYQISWGISATEALRLFQERLNTPLINRVCGVIIKAASAGGNVSDVLTLVSDDTKESQYAEDERRVEMITYIVVIYVAFFVFLATVLILNAVFIPQMEQVINQEPAEGEETGEPAEVSGLQTQGLTTESIEEIKQLYLAAAIIHGLGDGVVAGVLDTGRIANGLRHSFLMVLVAFLMLRVMLI